MLPNYIAKAVPNPDSNRAPWYKNTAPTYAGVFLWIVFYREIAAGTLDRANPAVCLPALLVAGLISYGLFYYIPALMGMRTGYPLYVVGSSTFGTQVGYVMPGLLMGVLQVGWMSVNAFVATTFIDRCGVIDGENPYGQRPATQGMLPSPCATSRSRDQPHLVKKSKPT